ncbi:MAG: hypothetical protein DRZ90_03980 [Spirochaetes bacterium]|nr:MAG: hypothetical protein DRZ90_03980 [Spirochaetota bacterium]
MIYFKSIVSSVVVLILFSISTLQAQETTEKPQPVLLQFRQEKGEVLHAESVVNESVFINGIFSHDAVIGESSVSIIRDVRQDGEGTAVLDTTFRTEERINGLPSFLKWVSSENVRLKRDARGRMDVPADAARPVLRNIPVFPEYPVQPGDSWTADAEEVHLFRISGRQAGPYRGEIPASYEYIENILSDGKTLARILIRYNIYLPITGPGEPVRFVSGRSEQNLYWDVEQGHPVSRSEDFEFLMMMSNGVVQEFRGHQEVSYRSAMELNREEVSGSLRRSLNSTPGTAGITVIPVGEGVLLSLEDGANVLFEPESAIIPEERISRLLTLKSLLERYPGRDILITGHTAHFGTEQGRKTLSEERAAAVAAVLFPDGRRGPGKLYIRGAGSDEPTASEGSEAGRAANRRVEILILD